MRIETPRCLIRGFEEEDLDEFMAYRNDGCWMLYQGFKGRTREEFRKALLGEANWDEGAQLAVSDRATGRLIGDVYLRREGESFWIGYTVSPGNARRGYASEAVQGAIGWIRACGARRVLANTYPENKSSRNLLNKLGFAFSGFDERGQACYALELCP